MKSLGRFFNARARSYTNPGLATYTTWVFIGYDVIIFLAGLPISVYAARHGLDMDLLTRGAGFGYIGSTITSLIYASFTFIFFALEAAIMAYALELAFDIPPAWGYLVCALVVIPLVTHGVTAISQLQMWTQPLWLLLLVLPYVFVFQAHPGLVGELAGFPGESGRGGSFDPLLFGSALTVGIALITQMGEQVDYLRFMPEKTPANRAQWWAGVLVGGPGWVIPGVLKMAGGDKNPLDDWIVPVFFGALLGANLGSFGGMQTSDVRRLRQLEDENARLKADLAFFESLLPAGTGGKGVVIGCYHLSTVKAFDDALQRTMLEGERLTSEGATDLMMRRVADLLTGKAAAPAGDPRRDWFFFDPALPGGARAWAGAQNLPELHMEHPAVQAHLWGDADSVVRGYLRDGVDGWRLDVAFDIGFAVLEELAKKKLKLTGETFDTVYHF